MFPQTDSRISVFDLPHAPVGGLRSLDFHLPADLEATEPPEARGLQRDGVRLMVSYQTDNHIEHTHFNHFADFLAAGDVVVINTSGTLPAALKATRADGTDLEIHLSTRLPAGLWAVEVRQPMGKTTKPFYTAIPGEKLTLPDGGTITLLTPYRADQRAEMGQKVRLWLATLSLPEDWLAYLQQHGFPIRYDYVETPWPLDYYQTTYATEMGSAEMPSAGRGFTPKLITELVAKGVQVVPLILHTGVASLEDHEPPYEEFYRVPPTTATVLNMARANGKRIVAVGTTVIRALETVTEANGITAPGEGWTTLVITPQRPIRAVNALLTGFHEPRATHLAMLQALAKVGHLCLTYTQALQHRYLWHEFGDLHLILRD